MIAIMAANRKVNKTTTRSPSWRPIEKLITLPHDRNHGGETFLLAAMMAIVW
jgi:hypothetical protein